MPGEIGPGIRPLATASSISSAATSGPAPPPGIPKRPYLHPGTSWAWGMSYLDMGGAWSGERWLGEGTWFRESGLVGDDD